MFTPPASPFPSPRTMEEMQRASLVSSPSDSSTSPPEYNHFSQSSYFPPSASFLAPKNAMPNPPITTQISSSSLPIPSTSPLKLSSPPSSAFKSLSKTQLIPIHDSQNRSETKRRIGRHIKWTAIAIPVVLALVTLGNHCKAEILGMAGWIRNAHVYEPQVLEGHDMLDMVFNNPRPPHPLHHDHHGHHHQPSLSLPIPTLADPEKEQEQEHEQFLLRRQVTVVTATGTATASNLATPTTAAATSTSVTSSSSLTATSTIPATAQNLPTVPTASPVLPTPFPQPWDSNISQNFSTQSCFDFFQNMTNQDNFRSCRPFGLLQSTSDVFADLQSNLTMLNNVVWGTCNPTLGVDQCTTNMATYASALQDACSVDLGDNNLNAVSTLQALQSYSLTYNTGCLTDPSTSSYCYVKAAHNTNPSDLYFYSLPQSVAIPNTSTLTCSSCTKSLMALYVNALNSDSTGELTELGRVYAGAEELAVGQCGSGYAQASTSEVADQGNGVGVVRVEMGWWLMSVSMSVVMVVVTLVGWV